jgi:hypothetical protein
MVRCRTSTIRSFATDVLTRVVSTRVVVTRVVLAEAGRGERIHLWVAVAVWRGGEGAGRHPDRPVAAAGPGKRIDAHRPEEGQ